LPRSPHIATISRLDHQPVTGRSSRIHVKDIDYPSALRRPARSGEPPIALKALFSNVRLIHEDDVQRNLDADPIAGGYDLVIQFSHFCTLPCPSMLADRRPAILDIRAILDQRFLSRMQDV
jgi:hypothetical protein